MKVYITDVQAIAGGISDSADWQEWVKVMSQPHGDLELNTKLISPMLRRRCSKTSKIALSLSLPKFDKYEISAGVFCSQHGELSNTVDIFRNLSEKEILSPNKFSQCVHNTASGLLSVQKKLTIPFNSIAAGTNTFQMGLIDAAIQLDEYKNTLLTMFDDITPEIYQELNIQYDIAYGFSCVVSKEAIADDSVCLEIEMGTQKLESVLPPALVFLAWFYGDRKQELHLSMMKIKEVK